MEIYLTMPSTSKWVIETTDERFEQDVIERSKEVPVVVDFWAEWCAPCRMLAPMLENLVMEFAGRFVLVKANTAQLPKAAGQFRIQSIPAVYGFRDGEVRRLLIRSQDGAKKRGAVPHLHEDIIGINDWRQPGMIAWSRAWSGTCKRR